MEKNNKFKGLILEVYNKYQEGNLTGILYGTASNYGFSKLTDIEEFLEIYNPNMIYIKSKLTDTEINVYEWELEDYKIKTSESMIYIKLKDRPEVNLMY